MAWRNGQAYSTDLRLRVLSASGSARETAERFGVSVSYVVKARQRRDRAAEMTARPQRCRMQRQLAGLHDAIAAHVRERPDATLNELRAWLRVNSLPIATPISRPITTPLGAQDWAYPRSA